jgi:hypothetical protein
MDPVFAAVESSALSVWLVESPSIWAFPFVLILHTVGLAFLVGVNVAWNVRLLGLGRGVPMQPLERYFRLMWIAFWVNAVSGVLLLIAYPTKALTNPLFYLKLALIGLGLFAAQILRRRVALHPTLDHEPAPPRLKLLAAASLACWVAAIFAGRFLAYTCTRLTVDTAC